MFSTVFCTALHLVHGVDITKFSCRKSPGFAVAFKKKIHPKGLKRTSSNLVLSTHPNAYSVANWDFIDGSLTTAGTTGKRGRETQQEVYFMFPA